MNHILPPAPPPPHTQNLDNKELSGGLSSVLPNLKLLNLSANALDTICRMLLRWP
jgi:hypothetical protein